MKTLAQFLGVLFACAALTACQTTDLVTYVVGASPDATPGGDADPPDGNAGDGTSDGGAIGDDGGPFGCLALPPSTLGTSAVTVQLVVTNWQDLSKTAGEIDGGSDLIDVVYTPLPGVAVTACDLVDAGDEGGTGCAAPAAGPATSDDAGVVSFPLSGAFTGFYRLTGAGLIPTSFFPGPMPAGSASAEFFPEPLLTYAVLQELNEVLGAAIDLDAGAGLGEVFLSVTDCNDHLLAGVSFSFSGDAGSPFYFVGGLPSASKTGTDKGGTGGAFNMPAGPQTITATYVGLDPYEPMSTTLGTLDVFVRPGEVTIGYVRMRALHQGP